MRISEALLNICECDLTHFQSKSMQGLPDQESYAWSLLNRLENAPIGIAELADYPAWVDATNKLVECGYAVRCWSKGTGEILVSMNSDYAWFLLTLEWVEQMFGKLAGNEI